ncbi:hypothetical protein O3P69_008529 [Scylla paramamosain]|uniref:SET domain-containing protein n=1 Tax=Scylla paramamosain TaxID=85552 RepID=A0AAW0SL84_SCYPA
MTPPFMPVTHHYDRAHDSVPIPTVRAVKEGGNEGDKVVGEEEVVEQLFKLLTGLQQVCPPLPPHPPPHMIQGYSHRALLVMESLFGYSVHVVPSDVAGARQWCGAEGTEWCQSGAASGPVSCLANPFILRCADGVLVDGCRRGLSGAIFRSCCGRDRMGLEEAADLTWLTDWPINPLNVGQYINNQAPDRPSNVAYQEVTLQPGDVPWGMRRFLPYLWCSLPPDTPQAELPLRLVALIATTDIAVGQELYSHYFTLIHSKPS